MTARQRSPKYPSISLKEAINRAKIFKDKEGWNKANIPVALKAWGYAAKSSGGLQTIASLKNYGLMNDEGSSSKRCVYLSGFSKQILQDNRKVSPERDEAIKQAALKPRIFAELWVKWGKIGLPSDENMEYFLLSEKNFNENSVSDLIKKFKETIEFAKLTSSDGVEERNEELDDSSVNLESEYMQNYENIGGTLRPKGAIARQVGSSIPVTQTCSMSILADGPVTQKGIEQLRSYLNLIKDSFPLDEPDSEEDLK